MSLRSETVKVVTEETVMVAVCDACHHTARMVDSWMPDEWVTLRQRPKDGDTRMWHLCPACALVCLERLGVA